MLNARIIWHVVDQWPLLGILALTAVLAWPLGRRLHRGALGVAFVAVLGAVLAATTTTRTPYYSLGGLRPYLHGFLEPGYLVGGFGTTAEKLANIGLFLPLGLLATLTWRRPVPVVAASAALSFLLESWQAWIGRGGDAVDVVHNSVGALLGTLLARALLTGRRPDRASRAGP